MSYSGATVIGILAVFEVHGGLGNQCQCSCHEDVLPWASTLLTYG